MSLGEAHNTLPPAQLRGRNWHKSGESSQECLHFSGTRSWSCRSLRPVPRSGPRHKRCHISGSRLRDQRATLIHRSQLWEFNSKAQPLLALKLAHYLATLRPVAVSLRTVQEARSSELKEAESRNANAQEEVWGANIRRVGECVCVSWVSDPPAVFRYIMTCLSLWKDKEEFDE